MRRRQLNRGVFLAIVIISSLTIAALLVLVNQYFDSFVSDPVVADHPDRSSRAPVKLDIVYPRFLFDSDSQQYVVVRLAPTESGGSVDTYTVTLDVDSGLLRGLPLAGPFTEQMLSLDVTSAALRTTHSYSDKPLLICAAGSQCQFPLSTGEDAPSAQVLEIVPVSTDGTIQLAFSASAASASGAETVATSQSVRVGQMAWNLQWLIGVLRYVAVPELLAVIVAWIAISSELRNRSKEQRNRSKAQLAKAREELIEQIGRMRVQLEAITSDTGGLQESYQPRLVMFLDHCYEIWLRCQSYGYEYFRSSIEPIMQQLETEEASIVLVKEWKYLYEGNPMSLDRLGTLCEMFATGHPLRRITEDLTSTINVLLYSPSKDLDADKIASSFDNLWIVHGSVNDELFVRSVGEILGSAVPDQPFRTGANFPHELKSKFAEALDKSLRESQKLRRLIRNPKIASIPAIQKWQAIHYRHCRLQPTTIQQTAWLESAGFSMNPFGTPQQFDHFPRSHVLYRMPKSLAKNARSPSPQVISATIRADTEILVQVFHYQQSQSSNPKNVFSVFAPITDELTLQAEIKRWLFEALCEAWLRFLAVNPGSFLDLAVDAQHHISRLLLSYTATVGQLRSKIESIYATTGTIDNVPYGTNAVILDAKSELYSQIEMLNARETSAVLEEVSNDELLAGYQIRPIQWDENTYSITPMPETVVLAPIWFGASNPKPKIENTISKLQGRWIPYLSAQGVHVTFFVYEDVSIYTPSATQCLWSSTELSNVLRTRIALASNGRIRDFDGLFQVKEANMFSSIVPQLNLHDELVKAANGSLGRMLQMGESVIRYHVQHAPDVYYLQEQDWDAVARWHL